MVTPCAKIGLSKEASSGNRAADSAMKIRLPWWLLGRTYLIKRNCHTHTLRQMVDSVRESQKCKSLDLIELHGMMSPQQVLFQL